MKEMIRDFIRNLGVDDVGFASVSDYDSPKSPLIDNFFPGARSIIVLAYQELSSCESPSMQLAMNGRYDKYATMHHDCYRISHFIETRFHAKTLSIPTFFTMDANSGAPKAVSEFSLRHAALAAGLGRFGRNNLIIHPRFGPRVSFNAILTTLELETDTTPCEDVCAHCDICVDGCPGHALDTEGQTDVMKCMKVSKPFSTNGFLMYVDKFTHADQEEKMKMLTGMSFMPYYQAAAGERDYNCFNCLKLCPIGRRED